MYEEDYVRIAAVVTQSRDVRSTEIIGRPRRADSRVSVAREFRQVVLRGRSSATDARRETKRSRRPRSGISMCGYAAAPIVFGVAILSVLTSNAPLLPYRRDRAAARAFCDSSRIGRDSPGDRRRRARAAADRRRARGKFRLNTHTQLGVDTAVDNAPRSRSFCYSLDEPRRVR